MNILSLFDGMACGMIALQSAGIFIDRYVAYEIEKYAIQTAVHNFPMIEQRGDVFEADFTEFEGFDFLIGGSPCTKWSIAQKNGRETEASGQGWEWFQQYVRALHEAKPKWFIYENNKSMSKAIRASIDEAFGFEAVFINSSLVPAQNRQRLYWVGKRNEDGTYSKVDVEQPEDRGILLKDVLESGVAWQDKSYAYTTRCQAAIPEDTLAKHRPTMVAEPINITKDGKSQTIKAQYQQTSVANICCYTSTYGASGVAEPVNTTDNGKAWTIKSQYYKNNITNILNDNTEGCRFTASGVAEPVCASLIEQPYGRKRLDDGTYDRRYEARTDGKSNALVATHQQQFGMVAEPVRAGYTNGSGEKIGNYAAHTLEKGCKSMAAEPVPRYATPCEWGEDGKPTKAISAADGKTYPVYEVKDGYITIKGKRYAIKLADGFYIIRKLTVRECMRLQTVPEWYEFPVSDTRAYQLLGNGWTIAVIEGLIRATQEDNK